MVSVKPNRKTRAEQHKHSCEKRMQTRLLCAELVQVAWKNVDDSRSTEIVVLENWSAAGAGLFAGVPLPLGTTVEVFANSFTLNGVVRHCVFRENGYIIGVELKPDSKWAQDPQSGFLPQHLLDVSRLDLG